MADDDNLPDNLKSASIRAENYPYDSSRYSIIKKGSILVDRDHLTSLREALDFSQAYIDYVKERYPEVHQEADGVPSIEKMIKKARARE